MFFIVNKTKHPITLGDIKIHLGPRQAIDLDKVISRDKSENSRALKAAKSNGEIEVRVKDSTVRPGGKQIQVPDTSEDLKKMKNEIISEIKGSINGVKKAVESIDTEHEAPPAPQTNLNISDEQMAQITQAILSSMPQGGQVAKPKEEVTEVEMDEDTLVKIHSRAAKKLVKDADVKSVHYKEETQDNTILSNVDELSDLL